MQPRTRAAAAADQTSRLSVTQGTGRRLRSRNNPAPPYVGIRVRPHSGERGSVSRHAIRLEQQYLDRLYQRVDELRAETADQLAEMLRAPGTDSTALLDRDAQVARLEQRTADLARAEQGLCFGRLDRTDDSVTYIGRMGLRSADLEPFFFFFIDRATTDIYTLSLHDALPILFDNSIP